MTTQLRADGQPLYPLTKAYMDYMPPPSDRPNEKTLKQRAAKAMAQEDNKFIFTVQHIVNLLQKEKKK